LLELAILLALVGVYGVTSFVVSRRTREIGIRVALGASRGTAMWLILREAALMLGCGVTIALPVVWGLGRLIESELFGVHATDWPTTVGSVLLVTCVALTASALPVAARGESLASHRDGRGAPPARRDDREYREYLSEEQRSRRGCIARRMQPDFHHGLLRRATAISPIQALRYE
jgi:hypothetical protein